MKQVKFQGAVKSRKQATHGPVLGPSTLTIPGFLHFLGIFYPKCDLELSQILNLEQPSPHGFPDYGRISDCFYGIREGKCILLHHYSISYCFILCILLQVKIKSCLSHVQLL